MNKIAITGSFATGKTDLSLALSLLTGFQHLLPKSDYETRKALIHCTDDHNQFYTYFMNCLYKLSDRLVNESLAERCYFSDGCILNEVAYLKAFHELSNQDSAATKKFKEQSLMIQSIENSVSYYFRKRYDEIILLNIDNDSISELSVKDQHFRTLYSTYLRDMLDQLGQSYCTYLAGDPELILPRIIEDQNLNCKISVNEAIFKAQHNLRRVSIYINQTELN